MGWFKKTEQPETNQQKPDSSRDKQKRIQEEFRAIGRSVQEQETEKLKAFRDIGQRFKYLGIEMIVISHRGVGYFGSGSDYPAIVAEYADKNGLIQNKTFGADRLKILKAENPEVVE